MNKRRSCKHNIQDVEYVTCPYCENSKQFKMLHWGHLKKIHNKTLDDTLKEFPNIPTMTKEESDKRSNARIKCDKKITKTCNKKYGGVGYASKELEEKTRDTVQKVYGSRNVMQSKKVSSKFKGDNNPQRNPEVVKRTKKTLKEFYKTHVHHHKGKTYNEIMGPERAAERIKELRISGALGQSLTPFISAPQKELFELVKQIHPDAKIEYPIDIFCIDIAIEDLKIAIEYDGSYWHDKERDIYRDSVLKEKGWSTIRFEDYVPSKEELILEINKNII
jgi:hypothetical protein